MLVNRELEFVKEAFIFADGMGQLAKPKGWLEVDYYYFLLRIGFEKGDPVMVKQGFPGELADKEPANFNIGRSNLLTPEQFMAMTTNEPIE